MMNELICVFVGHNWTRRTRKLGETVILHYGTPFPLRVMVEVKYRICRRCGREAMQGWHLNSYDD